MRSYCRQKWSASIFQIYLVTLPNNYLSYLAGESFSVSEEEISQAVEEALQEPLEPLPDSVVPRTLIPRTQLEEKIKITRPQFSPLEGKALKDKQAAQKLGVVQRLVEMILSMDAL